MRRRRARVRRETEAKSAGDYIQQFSKHYPFLNPLNQFSTIVYTLSSHLIPPSPTALPRTVLVANERNFPIAFLNNTLAPAEPCSLSISSLSLIVQLPNELRRSLYSRNEAVRGLRERLGSTLSPSPLQYRKGKDKNKRLSQFFLLQSLAL